MGSYTDVAEAPANHAGKIIELLVRAIPYPHQIGHILIGEKDVRFDWRGARYRVDENGHVEEVQGGLLAGSDRAILMQQCIAMAEVEHAAESREAST